MRRLPALIAAAALVLLVASPARAGEVTLGDDGFDPVEVTVAPGGTVVWTNASSSEYTVVAEDGAWDSGPLEPGDTFSITLRREATYAYGTDDGAHSGTVVVSAAAAEPEADPADHDPAPVTPATGSAVWLLGLVALGLVVAGAGSLMLGRSRKTH